MEKIVTVEQEQTKEKKSFWETPIGACIYKYRIALIAIVFAAAGAVGEDIVKKVLARDGNTAESAEGDTEAPFESESIE